MSGDAHVRFCEGLGVRFPRATRLVILCRRGARAALAEAEQIFSRMGLALNETKTHICRAPTEAFDFLGYRFGVQYHFGSGRPYVAAFPSGTSLSHLKAKLRRMIGSHMSWQSEEKLIGDVNRVVRGWLNYFSYGTLWKTYTQLERFLQGRIRGWLVHKHKVGSRGECRYPASYLYETLGLIYSPGVLRARARLRNEPGPRAGCGKSARPVR